MSNTKDLGKIRNLILDFFKTKKMINSLNSIHELEIKGWEKWWQVELAIYLGHSEDVSEWDMEHRFDIDQRTIQSKKYVMLDLGFRLKKHRKEDWYFLELKQHNDYRQCFNRMCKDIDLVYSTRKKSAHGITTRYLVCAGIFLREDEDKVIKYAKNKLDRLGFDDDGLFLKNLGAYHQLLIF